MSREYVRSDSPSMASMASAPRPVGGTTHPEVHIAYTAPPPMASPVVEDEGDIVVAAEGSSEVPPELADSEDPVASTTPPEPQGLDSWVSYEETADYRQHNSWAQVKCGTWASRCKWFGYKILDGADYVGGALASVLGITESRYQYVIDAADRMAYEREQEAAQHREDAEQQGQMEQGVELQGGAGQQYDPYAAADNAAATVGEEEDIEAGLAAGPSTLRAAPAPTAAACVAPVRSTSNPSSSITPSTTAKLPSSGLHIEDGPDDEGLVGVDPASSSSPQPRTAVVASEKGRSAETKAASEASRSQARSVALA